MLSEWKPRPFLCKRGGSVAWVSLGFPSRHWVCSGPSQQFPAAEALGGLLIFGLEPASVGGWRAGGMGRRCVPWGGVPWWAALHPRPTTYRLRARSRGSCCHQWRGHLLWFMQRIRGGSWVPHFLEGEWSGSVEAQDSLGGSCGAWVTLPPFLSILPYLQSPVTSQRQSLFPH